MVFRLSGSVFVDVVVASLHANCFNSVRGVRFGSTRTSSFNIQSVV